MMASVSALVIFITAGAMLLLDCMYGLNRILIGQH
jgi:putative spermidine/putrescine transport system permease protein